MAAFRTGRKGRYAIGVGEPSKASPAVLAVIAVLDRRNPAAAPTTPKGLTQQCWAGQSEEGDMLHNSRGKRTLSATTENMIKENLRNKK